MSKLFTMYVGTELTAQGARINPVERAESINEAKHILAQRFGGYSVGLVQGGYVAQDGKLAQEDSIRFEVTVSDAQVSEVRECAKLLRELFKQESVLLNCTSIESSFI